jgi:hypothetical protein
MKKWFLYTNGESIFVDNSKNVWIMEIDILGLNKQSTNILCFDKNLTQEKKKFIYNDDYLFLIK